MILLFPFVYGGLIKAFLKSLGTSPFSKIISIIFNNLFLTLVPQYSRNLFTTLSAPGALFFFLILLLLSLNFPHQTNIASHPRYHKLFSFSSISFTATVSWFRTFSKCSALIKSFRITICCPLPIFHWEISRLTKYQYNILLLCCLVISSRSLAILSITSTSHLLSSYFDVFSTFFTFLLFSYDLSLR